MAFAPHNPRRVRRVSRGALAAQHYNRRAHLFANANNMPTDGTLGFSLKPSKKIKAAVKKVGKTVGKVLDNKIVKGAVAGTLALTGVGIPASAAIMATQSAAAKAAQGKRIGTIAKGAATGAAVGAAAGVAGKVLPKVPGLRNPVAKIREKAASVPVLRKVVPKKKVPSYDASKLDALTSQPLPTVSVIPSTATALPKIEPMVYPRTTPVLKAEAQSASKKKLAESAKIGREAIEATAKASKEKDATKRKNLMERAATLTKKAKRVATTATQIAQVAESTTPPSANPSAPQGGFPVEPATPFPVPQTEAEQSAGNSIPPMYLIAAAGIAAFALMRK
jgi:hypothetical protein